MKEISEVVVFWCPKLKVRNNKRFVYAFQGPLRKSLKYGSLCVGYHLLFPKVVWLFPKVDEDRFESPIMIVHLTNNRLSSLPKNLCLD